MTASPNDKDGGAAFPRPASEGHHAEDGESRRGYGEQEGMSLRDYFAAKALIQFGEPEAMRHWMSQGGNDYDKAYALIAEDCYRMADAMLSARNQSNETKSQ